MEGELFQNHRMSQAFPFPIFYLNFLILTYENDQKYAGKTSGYSQKTSIYH